MGARGTAALADGLRAAVPARRSEDRRGEDLLARRRELACIAAVCDAAARGQGGALVVRGEPGSGKTALLRAATAQPHGLDVLWAQPVEEESAQPWSGLERLCRPVMRYLHSLPAATAAPLGALLSWGGAGGADSSGLAAGFLTLLRAAAAERPRCLVIDDANHLDSETADLLGRTARHLVDGDAVALLMADGATRPGFAGLASVRLDGLDPAHAMELLTRRCAGRVAAAVGENLTAACGGNPLALVELGGALTERQLAGDDPLPEPLPVGRRLREGFGTAVAALPDATREALAIAALSEGTLEVVGHALETVGLSMADLEPAERADVVSLTDSRLEWCHPLLRTATLWAVGLGARQSAHAALAKARAQSPPDRHAPGAPAIAPVSIRLLGGFSVERAGADVTPAAGLAAQAVKVLALKRRLLTDELVESLWPDAAPGSGRTRLRNVLARLRDTSGPLIVRDGDTVRLADGVQVDVQRFEDAADEILGAPSESNDALVRRALDLYGGEFLPQDRYCTWTAAPRERLARRWLMLVEVFVDLAEAAGATNEACALLERAIELHRYDEGLYVRTARLLASRGWRSRALIVLRDCRSALDELALSPGPAVRALEAELRGTLAPDA